MKQLLLLALMIPTLLWAQDDLKYLTNAVPVEEGKVTFTKEIPTPTLTEAQAYDALLNWARGYFTQDDSRVVYAEKADGDIAVVAENFLVFQSTALSLDRALMKYRVMIHCEDHLCKLKIYNIRYEYNVAYQKDPEKYTAENWITDKYALNKNGTKLNRGNGKFREKTIDMVDNIFKDAESALGIQVSQTTVAATETVPAVKLTPATPVTPAATAPTASKAGYSSFSGNNIPATLLQLLPGSILQVSAGSEADNKGTTATWKGIGNMFGKSIASATVNSGSSVLEEVKNNAPFNLLFYKEAGDDSPWFIIECIKQGETNEGQEVTLMGEINNVWIK